MKSLYMFSKPVLIFVLCLTGTWAVSQNIYLVRHAEKVHDGSKNPVLTIEGEQRARNIATMLSSAEIKYVYATDYQRTQLTAKPLSDLLGLKVITYDPSQLAEFAEKLKQLKGNALVVGHSNTTPQLTEILSGQPTVKLEETDFDYLFQVIFQNNQAMLNVFKSSSNGAKPK